MVNRAFYRFADDELFRIKIAIVVGFFNQFPSIIEKHHVQTSFFGQK